MEKNMQCWGLEVSVPGKLWRPIWADDSWDMLCSLAFWEPPGGASQESLLGKLLWISPTQLPCIRSAPHSTIHLVKALHLQDLSGLLATTTTFQNSTFCSSSLFLIILSSSVLSQIVPVCHLSTLVCFSNFASSLGFHKEFVYDFVYLYVIWAIVSRKEVERQILPP